MKKLLVSSLLLVSCLYVANAQSVREAIDKESYTGEWIFTVDEVVLSCGSGERVTVYSTDHGKEYPLANVDLQAQKVLFIESSADPILIKGADTSEIIAKGKSMCTGNERSPLPDISDKKLVRLAENRIIMNLPDPLSFKPVSNKVRKDDENIYVTISYKAKVNGQLVDGEDVAIFDYWARFVGFE